jgi:hypothetical protein
MLIRKNISTRDIAQGVSDIGHFSFDDAYLISSLGYEYDYNFNYWISEFEINSIKMKVLIYKCFVINEFYEACIFLDVDDFYEHFNTWQYSEDNNSVKSYEFPGFSLEETIRCENVNGLLTLVEQKLIFFFNEKYQKFYDENKFYSDNSFVELKQELEEIYWDDI